MQPTCLLGASLSQTRGRKSAEQTEACVENAIDSVSDGAVALSRTVPRGPRLWSASAQMVRASSVNAAATRRRVRVSTPSS
jgi:hypothetical protein